MKDRIVIALAGNPNSGKTSIFNHLTGTTQTVANYPGVTVEKKSGKYKKGNEVVEIVDLPGTYSLTAYTLDEQVARNFIIEEQPRLIVNVLDGGNLERNLYLTVQLMELGIPFILNVNMIDVLERRGIKIDLEKLSKLLGAPIVSTVGNKGKGIEKLKEVIIRIKRKGV